MFAEKISERWKEKEKFWWRITNYWNPFSSSFFIVFSSTFFFFFFSAAAVVVVFAVTFWSTIFLHYLIFFAQFNFCVITLFTNFFEALMLKEEMLKMAIFFPCLVTKTDRYRYVLQLLLSAKLQYSCCFFLLVLRRLIYS